MQNEIISVSATNTWCSPDSRASEAASSAVEAAISASQKVNKARREDGRASMILEGAYFATQSAHSYANNATRAATLAAEYWQEAHRQSGHVDYFARIIAEVEAGTRGGSWEGDDLSECYQKKKAAAYSLADYRERADTQAELADIDAQHAHKAAKVALHLLELDRLARQ